MSSTKMIIYLMLAVFLAQTLVPSASADDDEYFQKAIFRVLKEKNGQFDSSLNMTRIRYGRRSSEITKGDLEEKFCFKTNTGWYGEYKFYYEGGLEQYLYINETELYNYNDARRRCRSYKLDRKEKRYQFRNWADGVDFFENAKKFDSPIVGPNYLLSLFYAIYDMDKEKVKCEAGKEEGAKNPKKCSITFREAIRFDYSFVDGEEHTMIPRKVERYEQQRNDGKPTGEWRLKSEIQWLNFTPIFDQEPIVTADLPIQCGCQRIGEGYPTIITDYGSKFELELDVRFNYSSGYSYYLQEYGYERKERRTIRTYKVKLFVDKVNSINVAETIDETTNASIRTYYEAKSSLLHSVNLEKNDCKTYNLTLNDSLNWFYVQEIFARRPELFYANQNYSYLREFNLDGLQTQVVEQKVHFRYSGYHHGVTKRKNSNEVPLNGRVLTSHFYPKDAGHWPDNPNQLSVPKRIELGLEGFWWTTYHQMIIDIKSFKTSPDDPVKYDTNKCELVDKKKSKKN